MSPNVQGFYALQCEELKLLWVGKQSTCVPESWKVSSAEAEQLFVLVLLLGTGLTIERWGHGICWLDILVELHLTIFSVCFNIQLTPAFPNNLFGSLFWM